MNLIARCLALLLAVLALAGCRESEAPLVAHSSTSRYIESRNDLAVCGLVTLNRPWITTNSVPPYADDTVSAGFWSEFFPGAQPFPCHRLLSYRSQGVMMFRGTVPSGAALNTVNALLEISSFTPTVPIRVTEARPLSTGTTGSPYSGATRESCRFKVSSYPRTPYVPGPTNYGAPWITTTALTDSATSQFWVPLRDPQLINVSEEFRRSVTGGSDVVMRLIIEPDDRAVASAASNNCYGQFTVRLRIFAPDA